MNTNSPRPRFPRSRGWGAVASRALMAQSDYLPELGRLVC